MFHVEQRRMDYHLHTCHSMDGVQTVEELCTAMLAQGVTELCITDHIEPGHTDPAMDKPPVWADWFRDIREARARHPELCLRAGIEIGDNPAIRPQIMALLDTLPLDYRLLSLHMVHGVDCWEADRYYAGRTRAEAYREYAEAKAESALAWEDFDSLAHLGYVGRYAPYKGPEQPLLYTDAPDAIDTLLRSLIQRGKCLEINSSGYASPGCLLPHPTIIRRYIDLGGELFTFGSDAHRVEQDYQGVEQAKEEVRALGGKYQCGFAARRMEAWRI